MSPGRLTGLTTLRGSSTYLLRQFASRLNELLRCSRSAEYRLKMSNGKMVANFCWTLGGLFLVGGHLI